MYRDWIERESKVVADSALRLMGKEGLDDELTVAPAERAGPEPWAPEPAPEPIPPAGTRKQSRKKQKRRKR